MQDSLSLPPAAVKLALLAAGVEFIYAIQGRLSLRIRDEIHTLDAGDSIYFDATLPHGHRRSGPHACSALVATSQAVS